MCDQLIAENRIELITSKYDIKENTEAEVSVKTAHASYANSFFGEIGWLVSRGQLNVRRTPELFFARLGASVGFGVMIGTLFLFPKNTLNGIQHRMR